MLDPTTQPALQPPPAPTRAHSWRRRLPAARGPALVMALAPFALIAYLGLEGGGFDPVIYGRFGVAVWWAVLLGVLLGALSFDGVPRAAKLAVGALAAFAAWVGLSMIWSESADRSAQELARASTYLSVLVLFAVLQTREDRRLTLGSVAAGISFIAVLALLSRMEPEIFPKNETLDLVRASQERLNYPLNYWNGLAGLIAIGVPLLAHFAIGARQLLGRALASAALPALLLAIYLTLSRGGALALAIGLIALLALHPRRGPLALQLGIAALAGGALIWLAEQRTGFAAGIRIGEGLTQGDEMLVLAIVICALAGLWPVIFDRLRRADRLPRQPRPARLPTRARLIIAGGAVAAVLAGALLAGAPGEIEDGWQSFKESGVTRGNDRLESASGNGRYQWWDSALAANATEPLLGIGAGTFQFWWAREGTIPGQVVDAHSLYLESLAELGLIGALLILALVGGAIAAIGRGALRAEGAERALLAAAAAGAIAFAAAAATDWAWELPVLPVTFLIVVGAALGGRSAAPDRRGGGVSGARLALAALAVAGALVIAPALLGADAIRASQAQVGAGDLGAALRDAKRAERFEPYSGQAALQKALVLELQGRLGPAAASATEATEREPTNWETWLVLSRIEIERRRTGAGVAAFRRACELNPNSGLCQSTSGEELAAR